MRSSITILQTILQTQSKIPSNSTELSEFITPTGTLDGSNHVHRKVEQQKPDEQIDNIHHSTLIW